MQNVTINAERARGLHRLPLGKTRSSERLTKAKVASTQEWGVKRRRRHAPTLASLCTIHAVVAERLGVCLPSSSTRVRISLTAPVLHRSPNTGEKR